MNCVPGIKLRRTDTTLDLSSWEPRSDNRNRSRKKIFSRKSYSLLTIFRAFLADFSPISALCDLSRSSATYRRQTTSFWLAKIHGTRTATEPEPIISVHRTWRVFLPQFWTFFLDFLHKFVQSLQFFEKAFHRWCAKLSETGTAADLGSFQGEIRKNYQAGRQAGRQPFAKN